MSTEKFDVNDARDIVMLWEKNSLKRWFDEIRAAANKGHKSISIWDGESFMNSNDRIALEKLGFTCRYISLYKDEKKKIKFDYPTAGIFW